MEENAYQEITPQDLGSVLSVLSYIDKFAIDNNDIELMNLMTDLKEKFSDVFEVKNTDKIKLPYNRKSYSTILEYLKLQAEQLSEGKWNDFSGSDLGVVLLKLMSYLADMENYNVDKEIAELYLSTCTERASALLLCHLIGYEPRHYMSAETDVWMGAIQETDGSKKSIPDGTIFPKGSTFTTSNGLHTYTTLEDFTFGDNLCKVKAFEGSLKELKYSLSDVNEYGQIILEDYSVAFNTVGLTINQEKYKRVEDVTINTGELAFSIHCSEDRFLYIQLPAFWSDVLTSSSEINVSYCISSGEDGRLGRNKLTDFNTDSDEKSKMKIISNTQSIEGYNPETIDEIKIHAPIKAKTMDTIVTLQDFEDLGGMVDGIADIRALDYNDKASGLIQPTPGPGGYVNDAYKVNIYALPDTAPYDETIAIEGNIITYDYRDDNTCEIKLKNSSGNVISTINSGIDGEFYIDLPERGIYSIVISKAGYLDYTISSINVNRNMHVILKNIRMITGDVNGDGVVNNADMALLQQAVNDGTYDVKYDLNGDGRVNNDDIIVLQDVLKYISRGNKTNNTWQETMYNVVDDNKYRNTMIKFREDWEWDDMQYVAEDVEYISIANVTGNQITLTNYGKVYDKVSDIILGVDTLKSFSSFLPKYTTSVPAITEEFMYTINISGDDVIITMCQNWKDFLSDFDYCKLAVFFKQQQVLTKAGQLLQETIDARRLHSLWITYYDVNIIQPKINIEIYMDSRNTEFETIAAQVKDFILDKYSRTYLKCGDPIFASVIRSKYIR